MSRLRASGNAFRRVTDAAEFGQVAVLMGGASAEREISLLTGNAVLEALVSRGVNAAAFDPQSRPLTELVTGGFERVWIALHGPGGEDGAVQGALEWLGLPYTGSGVLGSAIGMDKLRTKRLAQAAGVATPRWIELDRRRRLRARGRGTRAAARGEARDAGLERRHEPGRECRRHCRRPGAPHRTSIRS